MPNYCMNQMTVSHESPQELELLFESMKKCQTLNDYVKPIPSESNENWFMERVNTWGTKWEPDMSGMHLDLENKTISGGFESAWAPPIGLFYALEEKRFEVSAMWLEPGMGFYGSYYEGFDMTEEFSDLKDLPYKIYEAFDCHDWMCEEDYDQA